MIFPSYFLISLRYLQAVNQNSTIRTMIKICFFGIFIGTFSIALIISITKGFEEATYTKMQSIYPQIIIDADGQELDYEQIQKVLQDPVYKIAYNSPQQNIQALCNTSESQNMPCVIQLRGIDPYLEPHLIPIQTMILPKNQDHFLEKLLYKNQVIIGKQLALQLHVSTGSQLNLIYTQDENISRNVDFDQQKIIVSGIFETGIDDFDTNFVYCSRDFFTQTFSDRGVTQIYAKGIEHSNEKEIIKKLQDRLHINVYSWKKLYSSLVSALELEKYAMFLILLLIILVASSNIISLLFMHITQKRKDIALLLTFGLPLSKVKIIFMTLSLTISTIAAINGLFFAYITGLFLQNYRWIQLPDNVYYTTHLPILMEAHLFLFIFFVVLAISFFASLIPLNKIKMKNITTILRNEI
ncbi:ABC transporter permease [Candidatus Babeliales bacterium]|nr:ABC transporter permease [Candidatus Babeliales bacterium]MBP9844013.1 ABC transporter permease [Candidatus Babeliales bacterium]